MIESLHTSIEAIKNDDFTGEWKTDIYLDPISERIYSFTNTGGIPMDAYNGIDLRILTVRPGAIAESVYDYLSSIEELLKTLLGEFEGTEWNGSNEIGKWKRDEDGFNTLDYIQSSYAPEIASYWPAGDWFSPITYELKVKWETGMTAEEIIDSEGCGDPIDGMCDRDEAIAWLEQQIEEWNAEKEDEEIDSDSQIL
jgi:hypothetical protein